jgi:hypothetical protein
MDFEPYPGNGNLDANDYLNRTAVDMPDVKLGISINW